MLNPIRNIVVPTDFSECADAAVARAASLARLDGATIHLIHALRVPIVAVSYEVSVPAAVWKGIRRAAEERIEGTRKDLEAQGVAEVTHAVVDAGEVHRVIDETVKAHDADLVVIGTHGHGGLKHVVLGSVAERTIRSVHCPVLTVKETSADASRPVARILVAVDFSPDSEHAVDVAAELAKRLGAAVDVVHAIEMPRSYLPYVHASAFGADLEQRIRDSAERQLAGVARQLELSGLSTTLHGRPGDAPQVISEVAKKIGCQLVVMGTRGNSGIPRLLLGSVAARTLREAPCSVMTVTAVEPEDEE